MEQAELWVPFAVNNVKSLRDFLAAPTGLKNNARLIRGAMRFMRSFPM